MINCALIGCGYWGSKLKKYIMDDDRFELCQVCDSKSKLENIWNDTSVEAVVIATPNATHYTITKAALEAGKHVLVEKPLALRTEECEWLAGLAKSQGLFLGVEYTYTFSPALQVATKIVREQLLGMEMSVKHLGRFGGGSVYWLLGSHMLSVLDMFIPLPSLEFSKKDLVIHNGTVETGIVLFSKPNFAGQIAISLNHPRKETKIVLYGKNQTIFYEPQAYYPFYLVDYERIDWTVELPQHHKFFPYDESHNLCHAIEFFVQGIRGQAASNADRATKITGILEELGCH